MRPRRALNIACNLARPQREIGLEPWSSQAVPKNSSVLASYPSKESSTHRTHRAYLPMQSKQMQCKSYLGWL
jgi:hypothetical protein